MKKNEKLIPQINLGSVLNTSERNASNKFNLMGRSSNDYGQTNEKRDTSSKFNLMGRISEHYDNNHTIILVDSSGETSVIRKKDERGGNVASGGATRD